MPSANQVKVTIGGPESPAGTEASRTVVIPHRDMPGLKVTFDKQGDPAISGENMLLGKYTVAGDTGGGIPLAFRPSAGIGKLLNSLLGQEDTPTQIAAAIRIRYTGSDASCKISANTSSDTLTSETGDKGSESGDASFGTSGDIDLTALSTDTVGELVTVINGYTDYECEKLFGADATDAADIEDITNKQAKDGWVTVWFTSSSSGAYRHQWVVDLSNTQRPTYSVQVDERQDNFLYTGCVVDSLALNCALRSFVEASVEILGFQETGGQSASSLASASEEPIRFHNGGFSVGPYDFTYIRNHSLTMNNQHRNEGYGQGSIFRQFHEKGTFMATGEVQVRLNSDADAIKDYVNATTLLNIYFYYTGGTITSDISEFVLTELPYCSIDDFDWPTNEGVIDANFPFEVVKGAGTRYNDPLTISFINTDSGAY